MYYTSFLFRFYAKKISVYVRNKNLKISIKDKMFRRPRMKSCMWLLLLSFYCFVFADFTVVQQDEKQVVIEYEISDFSKSIQNIEGIDYTLFQFVDAEFEGGEGHPAIPMIRSRLAVPVGAKLRWQVINLVSENIANTDILPLQYIDLKDKDSDLERDEEIYQSSFPFPEAQLEVGDAYNFRGVNIVPVLLYPIQYYPANHQVVIHRKMRIVVQFSGGKSLSVPTALSQYEQDILSRKIINYSQAGIFRYLKPAKLFKRSLSYDLSTGRWFRIPIQQEGIYRITGALLSSNGVDIGSVQISTLHLYNYGGYALPYDSREDRPEDLNEIAIEVMDQDGDGFLDENDGIVFYGKGLGGWRFMNKKWIYNGNPDGSQTLFPYDNTNYYILTFNDLSGKRIPSINLGQLPGPQLVSRFSDYYHFEEDKYNILFSGLDWYWLQLVGTSDKKTVTFDLPQNLLNDSVDVVLRFHGGSTGSETFRYTLKGLINGQMIFDNVTFINNGTVVKRVTFTSLNGLKGGSNQLEIQHTGNQEGCQVYLDYFEVSVHRPVQAENNLLRFRQVLAANRSYEYSVSGFSSGSIRVWDISDLANVRRIVPLQEGGTVVFQDSSGNVKAGEYLVFSEGVIKNIEKMESLENFPNLRDPNRKAEFLIITPDEFYESAEFLENLRESQVPNGLETERIRLSQIYLEFSSGVRDVTAIRDFIRYVYNNWSETLKYVLLFGDGHYDYRNINMMNSPNYIPPFEITNVDEIDSRETDNYYVALGMTDNLSIIDPYLPVARLPFNVLSQIEIYRDKLEKYARSYMVDIDRNGWQTWLTFVSDDQVGNTGSNHELSYHLQPSEFIVNSYIPRKFNIAKVYLHDYDNIPGGLGRWKPKATEDLVNQINQGTLLINYFGHGDQDNWAHEWVLNRTRDLPKFQNDYRLPLWVAATCTWGKYDNPSKPSMSEELIWRLQQGGIAVISASRPVYVSGNKKFAYDFYASLFNNRSINKPSLLLGDAFNEASGSSINDQKFHLYGDPTLRLADPQYMVRIESIEPDTLKALSTVEVRAMIVDYQENELSGFNGYAVLEVFDAVDKEFVVDGSERYDYVYNGGTIFKGLVTVSNGILSGRFIVPKSIKYDTTSSGRLTIYAWSEDEGDAVGFSDTLLFYGSEKQVVDQEGPEITVSFKDMPNFFDGDFVGSQPTLSIGLKDENGINLTGEVGHRIELLINENIKKDVTEFFVYNTDSYQEGKLEYTLPALSSGTHQLKITCWDNLNNFSEQDLSFRTVSSSDLMLAEVVNYPNPFSDLTHFTFQLVSPVGSADVTISIYTVTGRKIYEIEDVAVQGFNKIPVAGWDGRDWDGDIIANGVYLYKIVVNDGENRIEKIEKLAVMK